MHTKTSCDFDVSAFAYQTDIQGYGSAGIGASGWASTACLETPSWKPYFATFNSFPTQSSIAGRYGNLRPKVSGDSTWIGATIGSTFKEEDWGYKRNPKFGAVDFFELYEVLAMYVASIQNSLATDPTGVWNPNLLTYQCPLTLQEVGLLFRNVMMTAFKDTQAGVQGLYPIIPISDLDNRFTPYTAAANTCLLQAIDMHLPLLLIENIRALVCRQIHHAPGSNDFEVFAPVLGQFNFDVLDPANFTYSITKPDDEVVITPSFKPSTHVWREETIDAKGNRSFKSLAETPIDFIDGVAGAVAVCINNPMQLKSLADLWNNWLDQSGVNAYSMQTGSLGTETGVSILFSNMMTRMWVTAPPAVKLGHRKNIDLRLESQKWDRVTLSPYFNRLAVSDISPFPIMQSVWEQILSIWVIPNQQVLADAFRSTSVPKWQSVMLSTSLMNFTSGVDGVSMANMHSTYASKMTKAKNAPPNEVEAFLVEAARGGRGGILSGLIASAVGAFAPSLGGVASSIASALPF